jgi:hypothetical protein
VFARSRFASFQRYLRLDLLGGYLATRSQPDEDGIAAGADLAFTFGGLRVGLRYLQGVGDADDASILLGHVGFAMGGGPPDRDDETCELLPVVRSRWAFGFDFPLTGVGIDSQLGYLATGLAFELVWHAPRRIDLVTRADMLYYPGYGRDRVIHTAALGGVRIPLNRQWSGHWSVMALGGYQHGAALVDTTVGSGPLAELALRWSIDAGDTRLHLRKGLGDDNKDLIALFLSIGFEIDLDD